MAPNHAEAEATSNPDTSTAALVRRLLALAVSLELDAVKQRMAEDAAAAPEEWAALRAEYPELFALWEREP